MKLKVGADTILYPDVFVACDAADLRADQVFTAPTMVVEVLSPSTQSHDCGSKFTLRMAWSSAIRASKQG